MRKIERVLRQLNAKGELYLQKGMAGSFVSVTMLEPGVWEIRHVPEAEIGLHTSQGLNDLERATAWALAHPPGQSDLNEVLKNSKPD